MDQISYFRSELELGEHHFSISSED